VQFFRLSGSKFAPILKTRVLHLEAGEKYPPGHTQRAANPCEVVALCKTNARFAELVAETVLEFVQPLAVNAGFVGNAAIGCDATNAEPG
jgi:hypothetical protein